MSREIQDREDLLAEATGLAERGEFQFTLGGEEICLVAGFRLCGSLSLFWGQEEVWQFNSGRELRRGYCHGTKFGAFGRRLVWLRRELNPNVGQIARLCLTRVPMEEREQKQLLEVLEGRLVAFREVLRSEQFEFKGVATTPVTVTTSTRSLIDHLTDWLDHRPPSIVLATQPGLR